MKHKPTKNSVGFYRLHFEITKNLLLLNPHRFKLLSLFLYLKMNLMPPSYSRCPPSSCPIGLYFRARYSVTFTEFIKAKETDAKINVIKITSCGIKGSFVAINIK
jgi:hypothetical protein